MQTMMINGTNQSLAYTITPSRYSGDRRASPKSPPPLILGNNGNLRRRTHMVASMVAVLCTTAVAFS